MTSDCLRQLARRCAAARRQERELECLGNEARKSRDIHDKLNLDAATCARDFSRQV